MANKIFLGLVLVLSQHRGGPFPHGVHGKQCDEISVEELPAGCDEGIQSSCLHGVYTTHLGAYESKVVPCAFLQPSVCGLS